MDASYSRIEDCGFFEEGFEGEKTARPPLAISYAHRRPTFGSGRRLPFRAFSSIVRRHLFLGYPLHCHSASLERARGREGEGEDEDESASFKDEWELEGVSESRPLAAQLEDDGGRKSAERRCQCRASVRTRASGDP